MTLINHLPPFFRSLNARVKYFFFITTMNQPLSFSFPSTATSLVQLPRSMISLVDGYIFYYPNEIRRILSTQKET